MKIQKTTAVVSLLHFLLGKIIYHQRISFMMMAIYHIKDFMLEVSSTKRPIGLLASQTSEHLASLVTPVEVVKAAGWTLPLSSLLRVTLFCLVSMMTPLYAFGMLILLPFSG